MSKKNQRLLINKKADKGYGHIKETAQVMLTFIMMLGFFASVRDIMYNDEVFFRVVIGAGVIIILLHISKKFKKISDIASFAASIIFLLVFLVNISYGLLYAANKTIALWNLRFGTDAGLFEIEGNSAFNSFIFWIFVSIPLSAIINGIICRRMISAAFAFVIASMMFGFILGKSSLWINVICVTSSVTGMMIYCLTPERKIGLRGFACIILGFILFGAAAFIFRGYDGSQTIALWKKAAKDKIEIIRYGDDTLPKGKLEKAENLLKGDEDTLEISAEAPLRLYLTGFVGGKYSGNEWEPLGKEEYKGEYEGLMDWLEQEDFSPLKQYSIYYDIDKDDSNFKPEHSEIRIKNKGAYRRFVYLPHSVVSWKSGASAAVKDMQVQSKAFFGAKQYEFENINNAPNADEILISLWMQNPKTDRQSKYLNTESVYHHFVQEKYMDIDNELKELVNDMFFSDYDYEDTDFNAVTTQIRRILRIETQYVQYPQKMPKDKNFIKWFLSSYKKGNAVHYASAAVMAYRAAGYPARYAEGYYYSDDAGKGKITAELTNKNSHAWAEVYISGAGWTPVEVVPGMYTETYTNQIVEGKPAFQLDSKQDENGLDVDSDDIEKMVSISDEQKNSIRIGKAVASGTLLFLYVCFFLYIILELQRFIRISCRRRKRKRAGNDELTEMYAEEIQNTLKYAGVRGNYNHPFELTKEIAQKFPTIPEKRYERAVSLIQKVRFGEKVLSESERYALFCYTMRLKKELYASRGLLCRLKLRYRYATEIYYR